MTVKTFRARSMPEALAEVKRALGRDAVILHTRTASVGGWFGFGAKPIVEVTASASDPSPAPRTPSPAARAYAAARASTPPKPHRERQADIRPEIRPEIRTEARQALESAASRAEPRPEPPASPPTPRSSRAAIEDDLGSIKRMMGQVLQWSRRAATQGPARPGIEGAPSEPLVEHYLKLIEQDVSEDLADQVVGAVRDQLSPAELQDPRVVRQAVLTALAGLVPVATTPAASRPEDGRPLTIALIGPTGVGKTTTAAKLAAAYKLRHAQRVGLITTDTYRIAAVDQLRTYAEIIGTPLKVVLGEGEMASACRALGDCDIIIIDTAGRSPNDAERLDELRRYIDEARPHETHLVLAGNSSEATLTRAAARFAPARPNRVLFTKLDEAVSFGVLVTVASRVNLRLSYITTGQEVPDHIEPGRADRLARLALDGGAS